MKRALKRTDGKIWHYAADGNKVGAHERLYGDMSGICGNASDIWGTVSAEMRGNVSGLWGDVSCIKGDVSGFCGDVSGIRGNLDDCEISDEERKLVINISDLVEVLKGTYNDQ